MTDPPPPVQLAHRLRRALSVYLSVPTILAAIAVAVVLIARPAVFLGDGTEDLAPILADLLEFHVAWIVTAVVAVLLLAGLPPAPTIASRRVPWTLAVAAVVLVLLDVFLPLILLVAGFLFGLPQAIFAVSAPP